jgi:hypothetical protein
MGTIRNRSKGIRSGLHARRPAAMRTLIAILSCLAALSVLAFATGCSRRFGIGIAMGSSKISTGRTGGTTDSSSNGSNNGFTDGSTEGVPGDTGSTPGSGSGSESGSGGSSAGGSGTGSNGGPVSGSAPCNNNTWYTETLNFPATGQAVASSRVNLIHIVDGSGAMDALGAGLEFTHPQLYMKLSDQLGAANTRVIHGHPRAMVHVGEGVFQNAFHVQSCMSVLSLASTLGLFSGSLEHACNPFNVSPAAAVPSTALLQQPGVTYHALLTTTGDQRVPGCPDGGTDCLRNWILTRIAGPIQQQGNVFRLSIVHPKSAASAESLACNEVLGGNLLQRIEDSLPSLAQQFGGQTHDLCTEQKDELYDNVGADIIRRNTIHLKSFSESCAQHKVHVMRAVIEQGAISRDLIGTPVVNALELLQRSGAIAPRARLQQGFVDRELKALGFNPHAAHTIKLTYSLE